MAHRCCACTAQHILSLSHRTLSTQLRVMCSRTTTQGTTRCMCCTHTHTRTCRIFTMSAHDARVHLDYRVFTVYVYNLLHTHIQCICASDEWIFLDRFRLDSNANLDSLRQFLCNFCPRPRWFGLIWFHVRRRCHCQRAGGGGAGVVVFTVCYCHCCYTTNLSIWIE